jgi:NTP pyrophosphatase (non-canonical NTP hydrolase)
MALSVEVSELVEIFQWSTEEQSVAVKDDEVRRQAVADEIADVLIYAIRIADRLGIDVADAVAEKLRKNAEKHPALKQTP